MERRAWLDGRHAAVVADYDKDASSYGDEPYRADEQHRYVARLLELVPPGGVILDAPCGAGRYFGQVAEAGRRVVGIDQSAGMLAEAQAKGIAEALHHVGLQEMTFEGEFDAAMTIDAMENIPPEDWPIVLANLHRAVKSGGHLYLTVEEVTETEIDAAFADLIARGLPVVRGEVIEGDVAGYHYYPGRRQVLDWFADEGLAVLDERYDGQPGEDWGYRHFLLRDRSA